MVDFILIALCATMSEIGKYISYQFGGLALDAFSVRAILYAILTVIMLPFAKLELRKGDMKRKKL